MSLNAYGRKSVPRCQWIAAVWFVELRHWCNLSRGLSLRFVLEHNIVCDYLRGFWKKPYNAAPRHPRNGPMAKYSTQQLLLVPTGSLARGKKKRNGVAKRMIPIMNW